MISIVIPTLNEAASLPNLLSHLRARSGGFVKEIIISDGNSSDSTVDVAEEAGAIVVRNQERGRARQRIPVRVWPQPRCSIFFTPILCHRHSSIQ